jgi:ATP-binding cassette, subfamily B, bacterial MsbA
MIILLSLIKDIPKHMIAILCFLFIIVNVLELIGLSLFIPILDLLQGIKVSHGVTKYFSIILENIGLGSSLQWFLILLCTLFVLKAIITLWARLLTVSMSSEIQNQLRLRLMNAYVRSTVEYINTKHQGKLLSVINEHIIRASGAFFIFVQVILLWITVLAYGVFVLLISWRLTLIALFVGTLMIPIIRKIGQLAHDYATAHTIALENAQHFVLETLQAKKILNAMGLGENRLNLYKSVSESIGSSWQGTAFWSNSPSIFIQPISVIILSLLITLSANLDYSTTLLGTFILAFLRLLPTLQSALTYGTELKANLPSVKRVYDMLTLTEKSKEPNGNTEFKGIIKSIVLENLQFSYTRDGQAILSGIDLKIQKGQTVALVGPSGSGKTTLADLILGIYRPTQGQILIDNINLDKIELQSYRNRLAYIPQDPVLFHDTIRNNLLMGINREVSDEEFQEVCTRAGAWEFIAERAEGLEQTIGDRGVQLSGGQRQRLALARALLRKPELLILDEATSSLDQQSELWIKKMLKEIRENDELTVLIIAHRYTTIEHVDVIYEIRNGASNRLGTWNEAQKHLQKQASILELV